MADEFKVTKKVINAISENFSKLTDAEAASVGNKIGIDEDFVKQVRANPKSKQATEFFKNVIEKTKPAAKQAGDLVNAAQALFDQAAGRPIKVKSKEELIGEAVAAKNGKTPPPPAVAPEFRTESLGKQRDYTLQSPIGGPLVPAQSSRLQGISNKLSDVDPVTQAPMSTETALVPVGPRVEGTGVTPEQIADAADKAKPGKPGQGIKEGYIPGREPSLQEEQPGMEQLPQYNLGIGPSKRTVTRAGLGVAGVGAGAAVARYTLFGDKPLAQQADAGQATQATEAKDVQEVVDLADKAAPVLPPELAQKAKENSEKIKTIEDLLADVEARKQRKVDRIELLQAIETMTHGLVTAIGAGVLLNRNSPFAVDFSKGPKVDWAAQLDRLQKDFDTQTNALIKKYGIDQEMKAKQEAAVESKRRHEERMGLEREKLELEKTKAGQQQAEKQAKLTAAEQKQYNTNLKHYGDLRKAITEKKPGAAEDAATLLGADETTLQNLKTAMNQGMWDKVLNTLGISESPTTEQVLQGLRPKKPAAPAAAAPAVQLPSAIIDPEGKKITRPSNITDEVWKQSIDNIESHWNTQNKLIKKEY
jgi:hypothetical protein